MNIHNPLSPSTKPSNGRAFTLHLSRFILHFPFFIFHSSLFILLTCCTHREAQMREVLLQAKEQNLAYIPFTSDSALRQAVDYYDRHGTPNDRLLARYLLVQQISIIITKRVLRLICNQHF